MSGILFSHGQKNWIGTLGCFSQPYKVFWSHILYTVIYKLHKFPAALILYTLQDSFLWNSTVERNLQRKSDTTACPLLGNQKLKACCWGHCLLSTGRHGASTTLLGSVFQCLTTPGPYPYNLPSINVPASTIYTFLFCAAWTSTSDWEE